MGLFDKYKKKKSDPVRDYTSDASSFSTKEISKWMREVENNPNIIPDLKDDTYIRSLLDRIKLENEVSVLGEQTIDGVREIAFAINRSAEGPDNVTLSYALYNPYVAFITTGIFPFAGDSANFENYSLQITGNYPFLQIGADYAYRELPNIGKLRQDAYGVRTMIPLLENDSDYENLFSSLKCLPIYGYDLRDGFHSDDSEPYADAKYGINIQLLKVYKILSAPLSSDEISAEDALWGENSEDKMQSASYSNEYLASFTQKAIGSNNNVARYNDDRFLFISCPKDYKNLWEISAIARMKVDSEESTITLLEKLGKFCFPYNYNPMGLYQAQVLSLENGIALVEFKMINCIPNKIDAKVIAWQISQFKALSQNKWNLDDDELEENQ